MLAGLGSVSTARHGPAAGTKKPLTQEGPPYCRALSASVRPDKKQEDSGHDRQCTARVAGPLSTTRGPSTHWWAGADSTGSEQAPLPDRIDDMRCVNDKSLRKRSNTCGGRR
ncbi:hypothetical protein Vlu01_20130 [Micromonospora lutea]|uniref:Uncharacterized protein n=1 Tax=Micromonospora lutea TaxID=419825 RepID=A0ABQ4ITZ6_9ACTN|nr:hypothetical protein Vlu01_20130 [Micromonospora lutea]